jgi:hypothetical protein
VAPKQDGTGGTWNFQLRPALWFGIALCENQSYPNRAFPDARLGFRPDCGDVTSPDASGGKRQAQVDGLLGGLSGGASIRYRLQIGRL